MVTDEYGLGVLTVTDVRYEDAGAYSCEAINSNGREFAIPDTIVEIRDTCSMTGFFRYTKENKCLLVAL
jgi:hypothetical protein